MEGVGGCQMFVEEFGGCDTGRAGAVGLGYAGCGLV